MTLSPTAIEKLKELATKATPGPWRVVGWKINSEKLDGAHIVATNDPQFGWNRNGANRDYIAAADPSTVLSLIAALSAKDAEIERLKALVSSSEAARYATCGELLERVNTLGSLADDLQARIRDLGNERDAAEAALKEAREGLSGLFEGGFIEHGLKWCGPDGHPTQWASDLEARLAPCRALLSKQDSGKESQ